MRLAKLCSCGRNSYSAAENRTGDQLREESDEQRIVDEVVLSGLTPEAVDLIADLVKSEEGDAKRQNEREQRNVPRLPR